MGVSYENIFAVIKRIPKGRVATYGQIARIAGCSPRSVGYALSSLADDGADTPWHRVVNSKGEVSPRSVGGWDVKQKKMLQGEGVEFTDQGKIALSDYAWIGVED